jgi:hypothetical protein
MFEEFLPLQHCAAICYEANRMLSQQLGEELPPPWAEAGDYMQSSMVDGVKAIHDGIVKSPEESHATWMKRRIDDGWIYGEKKDDFLKVNPYLVPFSQLPEEQKIKSRMFFNIVTQFFASHPELSEEAPD